MSDARSAPLGGPLGELISSAQPYEAVPYAPIHLRALESTLGGGAVPTGAWVLPVWADPGGQLALHEMLKARIEGTLLQELSRSAASFRQQGRKRFERVWLFAFAPLDSPAAAIRAFGFRQVPLRAEMQAALAHVRQEAARMNQTTPDAPLEVYEASIHRRAEADAVEDALLEITNEEVWGERPGECFRRLAQVSGERGLLTLESNLDGLRQVEQMAPTTPEVIRWIPPMVFQAMADLVGLIAHDQGLGVDWAECAEDESEPAPPPLLRLSAATGEPVHLPIGQELMRWCVMPSQPGEIIPSVAEWVADVIRQIR